MNCSIIIRTLNEEKFLDQLLNSIKNQNIKNIKSYEVIIIDSGSTDNTLEIAKKHDVKILHLKKEDFSFGKSLNYGCKNANGDILVFVSGHCVPLNNLWLENLTNVFFRDSSIKYTYGRQIGDADSSFSELVYFDKFFPENGKNNIFKNYFCNNANSALLKDTWLKFKFNEKITGLEDIDLAKRILEANEGKTIYVNNAGVLHHHNENFKQIMNRYKRESYAMKFIHPEINFNIIDTIRILVSNILYDFSIAIDQKKFFEKIFQIFYFRIAMSLGTYTGNHLSLDEANKLKKEFFYPKK